MTGSEFPVSAKLVQRLRQITDLPWMECKRLLASLDPTEQERYIEAAEFRPSGILHDPIEDDPAVRPLYLAVCEEATNEMMERHSKYVAELELRTPGLADMVASGRGLCHAIWRRIKEILLERHGIQWRSPAVMNPMVIFD